MFWGGYGSLLPNVVNDWIAELKNQLENKEGKESSAKILDFLQKECSEKNYVDGIECMINELK